MKPSFVPLLTLLLATRLLADDLSQTVAETSKYESGANTEPLRQIEKAIRESGGQPAQRAEVEAALIKLLAPSSTLEARRFACLQLSAIGTESSLPAIAALLQQPETTGMACLALGSHPSPKANEILRAALPSSRGEARAQIILTLGDRGDAAAVPLLAEFALDADGAISEAALGSLGKIANEEALKVLSSLRRGGQFPQTAVRASLVAADNNTRRGNRAAAVAIYEELLASSQPTYVRRAAFEGLLRTDSDLGEQRILAALRAADPDFKASALAQVRAIQSPTASAKFAREIPKLAPSEQALMVESLAARNDDGARAAITTQLSSAHAIVRRAAVLAFTRVGDANSVPALAKALGAATQAPEQQTIELALASLPGGTAVDNQIIAVLKSSPPASKNGLINALARRGSVSAVPVLLDEAGHSNATVASAAFRALGKLAGGSDLAALLDKLVNLKIPEIRDEAESAVLQVISRSAAVDQTSSAVLSALAKAKDVDTRCALIGLLPACGSDAALAAVQSARANQVPVESEAAFRALTEWPNASAIDLLLDVAQSLNQNSQRVLALRGLVRLLGLANDWAPHEISSRFEKIMSMARNADEQKLLLGGLAKVHDPAVFKLIEPLLSNASVQAEAALAIVSLSPHLCGVARDATRAMLQQVIRLPVDKGVQQSARDLLDTINRFEDFIIAWQVTGPYLQEGKDGQALFDVVFPPETVKLPVVFTADAVHKVQTWSSDTGKPLQIHWQTMPAGTRKDRPWQLDLAQLYPGDQRVAYARTWIYSETAQSAQLEFGSDDGIKVWLNGQVVLSANRGGDVVPGSEKATVKLLQGWNPVLLKITQWNSGWGFCARVAKPDGTPIEGVRTESMPVQ